MDKKLAKENIGLSKHLSEDLKTGRFGHAMKISRKIDENIHYIRHEVASGKAKKER